MTNADQQIYDARLPQIESTGLAARILDLRAGERLTIIGLGRDEIGDLLRAHKNTVRGALLLEPGEGRSSDQILDRVLDDLAALAFESWPDWYGREEVIGQDLLEHVRTDRLVSGPWLRAAAKQINAGRHPRFRRTAKDIEFRQLMRAVDPMQPVLIAAIDPFLIARAAPVIQALEWCAARGASVVAAFSTRPPFLAPYDRVLYGALEVVHEAKPAQERFIAPPSRAHHFSAVEQRVEAALRLDAELGALFSCNETVTVGGFGPHPRVDLLWREGRVIVELDGPDHQDDPKFANDRHRDYELLVAGYLVLRITNDQVDTDLQRAIEKIRAVVRFRRQATKVQ